MIYDFEASERYVCKIGHNHLVLWLSQRRTVIQMSLGRGKTKMSMNRMTQLAQK